ncbi:MAG: hypothetical protein WBP64_16895, partial [Nitrososphaeraceae archaeon]
QQIKSDVCANRFYTQIEEQKAAVSGYLESRFGTWNDDRHYDTYLSSLSDSTNCIALIDNVK